MGRETIVTRWRRGMSAEERYVARLVGEGCVDLYRMESNPNIIVAKARTGQREVCTVVTTLKGTSRIETARQVAYSLTKRLEQAETPDLARPLT